MSARILLVVVTVVSAFTLSACKEETAGTGSAPSQESEAGAPTGSTPAATEPAAAAVEVTDACSLLTAEEITSAVGEAVEGKPSTSGGVIACSWLRPGHRSLTVQFHKSARRFDDSVQALRDFYKVDPEPVSGVGERAFYVAGGSGRTGSAIVVALKNGRFVNVELLTPPETLEAAKPDAVAVGRAVIDRI